MFDVGFSELILLGVVALVVLGPEKLPHAARMAGAWFGRIRRTMIDIQAEIEKEVSAAELRQRMDDEIARLKSATNPIEEEIKEIENTIHQKITDASQTVDAAPAYLEQAHQASSINHDESQENNSVPPVPSLPPSKVNLIKS